MSAPIQSWTDVLPMAATFVSGGLAGAIFTYFANRRTATKKQRRLRIETKLTRYSLPTGAKAKSPRVSYAGQDYEALVLFEMRATNISSLVISDNPFVIEIPEGAKVVAHESAMEPVGEPPPVDQEGLRPNQHRYKFRALHPRDSASVWMLLSDTNDRNVIPHYRGTDDVQVVQGPQTAEQSSDADDIRSLVFLAALFVLCGSLGAGELIAVGRALIMAVSPRYIVRLYTRWAERREQSGSFKSERPARPPSPRGSVGAMAGELIRSEGPFIGSVDVERSIKPAKPPRNGGLGNLPPPPR